VRALVSSFLVCALALTACGGAAATTTPPATASHHASGPSANSSNAVHVDDPAHIAGTWSYIYSSSCDDMRGHGEVVWTWNHDTAEYSETGWVEWDSGDPGHSDWACTLRWEATTEELVGVCPDKTGESTTSRWVELPEAGGLRAWELAWSSGDCSYSGIARR
jgi:hypothetical protein